MAFANTPDGRVLASRPMGIEAIAVLAVPFADVTSKLTAVEASEGRYRGLGGQSLTIVGIGDATLIHTRAPFSAEPEELAELLRSMVGDVLDGHGDERGVLVFPDKAKPLAHDYQGIVAEIGEAGFWVPCEAAPVEAGGPGAMDAGALGAALEQLMGAMPPGLVAQMQGMLAGADLGALAQAAQQLQSGFAGREHELLAGLQGSLGAAREMLGDAGAATGPEAALDPARLAAGVPSEDQAPALWKYARDQVEAMRGRDPDGFAALERSVRAAAGAPETAPAGDAPQAPAEPKDGAPPSRPPRKDKGP